MSCHSEMNEMLCHKCVVFKYGVKLFFIESSLESLRCQENVKKKKKKSLPPFSMYAPNV